ncbi:hypothetical protein H0266_13935 [Halobacillus locisalis]|uniref:HNH endonuclease n=1 Tax=Halobacillus locisalis TaxID=220753 RepID=A0A838CV20_9BACI|nr:hypothetical protein [Halobacillus locisalis]MBA2175992.1 hypothetical protein [Halobacillus locisalis]
MDEFRLTIEIGKPSYAQYNTVREAIPRSLWNAVRNHVHERSGHMCEICGKHDPDNLHAHEVWDYDEEAFLLILKEIQSLCKSCHDLKHFHHAVLRIKDRKVRDRVMRKLKRHFMRVNDCTEKEFTRHYYNQLAKSEVEPDARSMEDLLEMNALRERQAFLMRQQWRFVVADQVPFADEIRSQLES